MVVDGLQAELTRLRAEKTAWEAQQQLFGSFLEMARATSDRELMTATLQKTLDIAATILAAEKGSVLLLDDHGAVSASLLTRGEVTAAQRRRLIGTVLDKGLAGWVARTGQVGLVADTASDDRWVTLPDQPYTVRAALAVPIVHNRSLLGILTLLHSRPGHFTAESSRLMQLVAGQMAIILANADLYVQLDAAYRSLARAKQEVESYSRALDLELEKGRRIQQDFLPLEAPAIPGIDIAAGFHPARQLSGDFYDVLAFDDRRVGIVIADVCDKGVGAALFMGLFRSLLRIFAGLGPSNNPGSLPGSVAGVLGAVGRTNDYIATHHERLCMFATLFFGILNPAQGTLAYVNAGHEPPFIVGPRGVKTSLAPTGPAVGLMPGIDFGIRHQTLAAGDILLGYTDGITEAVSSDGEFFGKQRFERPGRPAGRVRPRSAERNPDALVCPHRPGPPAR